ncbi:hypothetical protein [Micromonospora haikouensis]|uniref:hypothetical protein n=1 Tax=Micromonospora haikouensis TaxID=686309 RepID=UPI003D712392
MGIIEPRGVRALYIPEDLAEPVEEYDLAVDAQGSCYDAARAIIKNLIQKVTVLDGTTDGKPAIDFLMDEEALYTGRNHNHRATLLMSKMKHSFAAGRFPGRTPDDPESAAEEAALWSESMRLVGPVLVIGADDRTCQWVSLPESTIVHAQHLLAQRVRQPGK